MLLAKRKSEKIPDLDFRTHHDLIVIKNALSVTEVQRSRVRGRCRRSCSEYGQPRGIARELFGSREILRGRVSTGDRRGVMQARELFRGARKLFYDSPRNGSPYRTSFSNHRTERQGTVKGRAAGAQMAEVCISLIASRRTENWVAL